MVGIMKYITSVAILFLFLSQPLRAVPVKGIIKDHVTGETLTGATIAVKEQPQLAAISGLDGSFSFQNINDFPVTLVCSYLGYQTAQLQVTGDRETAVLDVALDPSDFAVNEVVVYGNNSKNTDNAARNIEKTSLTVMNVVSAKAIEISPDLTVAHVIQRVSGVSVERNNSGDGQYAILRGMDKRYNYTLVNGIKIPSPDNKNRFVPLDIFPSELLDRLEVTKSLTADMEGDGIGGAVNLVMKEAPSRRQLSVHASTGYNTLFTDRDFYSFNTQAASQQSPYELYGAKYAAKPRDFSTHTIDLKSGKALPNLFAGFSYGDRMFKDRLGIILSFSYQNSYRGSNSLYFDSGTTQSDASNLPVLSAMNDRKYSEQQTRYGLHAKLDYRLSENHSLQWYNAYMDFANTQVRDIRKVDLSIGYNPAAGDYNLSYSTRFRWTHQTILNSTLAGKHDFLSRKLKIGWSAVYSKALNEEPDNATVYTGTTVRSGTENPISVVTLGGASRRWEHNSDEDKAVYGTISYAPELENLTLDLSTGGLYRDKQRVNFFNQYDFRPYDETKPEEIRNNLIQGVDWNTYPEIKFTVFNPYGSTGNPLNYDASEKIAAGYLQAKIAWGKGLITAGLRAEHTVQGYDLKYPVEGAQNRGEQIYTDYLPCIHLKYQLSETGSIRAAYSKSINRPSFFEIVPYRIINEEYTEAGNPDLKHTVAHNIDFRYEYFPKPAEQFMLGLFYKKIINPIEVGIVQQGQSTFFMPSNFGNAVNYGVEADFIKYFYAFGIKANYTFTRSNIVTTKMYNYDNPDPSATDKILVKNVEQSRPLNGQASHVANLSFLYKNVNKGWDAQIAGYYTSDRMYAVSKYLNNDIWQAAYFQLDASLEKHLKTGWGLFFKASNLLDIPMIHYLKKENEANEKVLEYEKYKNGTLIRKDTYGRNIQIGCRYKF
jgi:TonB-dependent receptor